MRWQKIIKKYQLKGDGMQRRKWSIFQGEGKTIAWSCARDKKMNDPRSLSWKCVGLIFWIEILCWFYLVSECIEYLFEIEWKEMLNEKEELAESK